MYAANVSAIDHIVLVFPIESKLCPAFLAPLPVTMGEEKDE